MKCEQRREQIVLERGGLISDFPRQICGVQQFQEGLLRIERRTDEMLRFDDVAVTRLDPDGAAVFNEDAGRPGHVADIAAALAYGRLQRPRERGSSSTR